MSRVVLKNLIGNKKEATTVVAAIADAIETGIVIEDDDGRLILGTPNGAPAARHPVSLGSDRLGWVSGSQRAEPLAALLDLLAAKEAERKTLGQEVLHLYREVNLIYGFSEKLAALLDLEAVATLTLRQARQLIDASDGAVVLIGPAEDSLERIAGFGAALGAGDGSIRPDGLIASIARGGNAEIVNDTTGDERNTVGGIPPAAFMCAPLKVNEKVIGAIALANDKGRPYVAGDLKLLNTLALQAATAIENARLFENTVQAAKERERLLAVHKELEVSRAKLEREMELAASIQANLFPSSLPPLDGYDVAARNRPARHCGGDYYDVLQITTPQGESHVLLCVADVSGKGLPASLLMSSMQATLRALLGRIPSLVDLTARASDLLFASTSANKYVTAALLELVPASGEARFVSAGHSDCLLVSGDGSAVRLTSTGAPLGLLGPGIPYADQTLNLAVGDCLALFSDGVTDAENEMGEQFGEERLLEVLQSSIGQPADVIVNRAFTAIDEFAAGTPQFDDITLLVLKKLA
jgi:serine phosphatase RsbU (regulator of sigma subunit)